MFSISPCSSLVLFEMLSPLRSSTDGPTEVLSCRDSNTVEQVAWPVQNGMCSWNAEQQGQSEEAGSTQNASWGGLVSNTSNSFCFWEGLKWEFCLQKNWHIQEGGNCYLHIGTDCSWNSSEGILKDFSLFAMTLLCGVHTMYRNTCFVMLHVGNIRELESKYSHLSSERA